MWQNFKSFLARPYDDDMDALHWFFFFGFLIAVAVGWNIILRIMRETLD